MNTSIDLGRCPSCELPTSIGEPCTERGCAKRGYHGIPIEDAAQLNPRSTDNAIGTKVEEYLLVGILGAGGFGKVYRALQIPILMPTALKLMHGHMREDPNFEILLRKFEGEAQALAALSHPNIVRLLKYGIHYGVPYLVMELVEGARTLKKEISQKALRGEEFESKDVFHILRQCVDGMEAAHARQIVHRDMKPENIMLQPVAGNPNFVRILDFGLAKFVAESSETSVAMGTPIYMAPEQLTRKNIGPWTDLYAVGVVTFELLTGRRPFTGRTHQEVIASKLNPHFDPTERLADLNLPPELHNFLRRSLARDPENRYRSAKQFRAALEQVAVVLSSRDSKAILSQDLSALLDSEELSRLDTKRRDLESKRRDQEARESALAHGGHRIDPGAATLPRPERSGPKVIVRQSGVIDDSTAPDPGFKTTKPADGKAVAIVAAVVGVIFLGVAIGVGISLGSKESEGQDAIIVTQTDAHSPRRRDARKRRRPKDVAAAHGDVARAGQDAGPRDAGSSRAGPGLPEEMTLVSPGTYPIGCRPEDKKSFDNCYGDEEPSRMVRILKPYAIMRHEVTMEAYDECVAKNGCTKPGRQSGCNWQKPGREKHPINCVSGKQALKYCQSRGWRLPTELEWEIAARGVSGAQYPWGDDDPSCDLTVMMSRRRPGCGKGGTHPVGSKAKDKSWCGAIGMGGNVREWTSSRYGPYGEGGEIEDPSLIGKRVNRGGSYLVPGGNFNTSHTRLVDPVSLRHNDLGFRCAVTLEP